MLCTGYVMPGIVRPTIQRPTSSWAIATEPQPRNLWPDEVLIWEASRDYHYARSTSDGRIIFGGEDDDAAIEPHAREALTPAKRERLNAEAWGAVAAILRSRSTIAGPERSTRQGTDCR